jgi:hypothetical protein
VHHLDLVSAGATYRVFLLPGTLQVDLSFAPSAAFGARAPTFRLLFGEAAELPVPPAADREELVGWGWLYALHARSCIRRGRLWQAEHMVTGIRVTVLTLACLRLGLPPTRGRGFDRLPADLLGSLEGSFAAPTDAGALARAFAVAMRALAAEVRALDPELAARPQPSFTALVRRSPPRRSADAAGR